MVFRDRIEAGRALTRFLRKYSNEPNVLALALPRGGVPVAFEIAQALHAPLDVLLVRKLGVPGHEELAMGAIASGGVLVLNEDVVEMLNIPPHVIDRVAEEELRELRRREEAYRGNRPPPAIAGRTVILVDDGLATGSTMKAAARAIRQQSPARLIIAVPVGARQTCEELESIADEVVCAATPEPFYAVGMWYEDFAQTSDEEVKQLLEEANQSAVAAGHA